MPEREDTEALDPAECPFCKSTDLFWQDNPDMVGTAVLVDAPGQPHYCDAIAAFAESTKPETIQ